MKKAILKHGGARPGSGRPATGKDPMVSMRMSEELIAAVRNWASGQQDNPRRSEAIRRLVEIGLKATTPSKPTAKTPNKTRAAELAAKVVDGMIDPSAPADERDRRRRRLTKGPLEFREDRVDQPKAKK
jgi:hypothetical protein